MNLTTPTTGGNGYVPTNVTNPGLTADGDISVSASTALEVVFASGCRNILTYPDVSPAAVIYVKYGYGATNAASASNYDRKITETYPAIQEGVIDGCDRISYFSTVAFTGTLTQLPG